MREMQPKLHRSAILTAVAAALTLGGVAHAQTSGSQGSSMAEARASAQAPLADYRALRASEINGMSVIGANSNNIGQVEDLVVDLRTGEVRYAVLRFDPGFFSAERLIPVPTSRLYMAKDRNDLVLPDVPREQLERVALRREQVDGGYLEDMDQLARLDQTWGIGNASGPVRRASDLVGMNVNTPGGDSIGELQELVIDMSKSRVHYAVFEFDPGWLQAERTVALPLQSFSRSATSDDLELKMDKGRARELMAFDAGNYDKLNDRDTVTRIDRYLVTVPVVVSSTGTTSGSGGAGSGGGSGASASASTSTSMDSQAGAAASPQGSTASGTEAEPDTRAMGAGAEAEANASARTPDWSFPDKDVNLDARITREPQVDRN